MFNLETLVHEAMSTDPLLSQEYVTYSVYLPSYTSKGGANSRHFDNKDTCIGEFVGSRPSQFGKADLDVQNDQIGKLEVTTKMMIDVLDLPFGISTSYIIYDACGVRYAPLTEYPPSLLGRNVKLEVKVISA